MHEDIVSNSAYDQRRPLYVLVRRRKERLEDFVPCQKPKQLANDVR